LSKPEKAIPIGYYVSGHVDLEKKSALILMLAGENQQQDNNEVTDCSIRVFLYHSLSVVLCNMSRFLIQNYGDSALSTKMLCCNTHF